MGVSIDDNLAAVRAAVGLPAANVLHSGRALSDTGTLKSQGVQSGALLLISGQTFQVDESLMHVAHASAIQHQFGVLNAETKDDARSLASSSKSTKREQIDLQPEMIPVGLLQFATAFATQSYCASLQGCDLAVDGSQCFYDADLKASYEDFERGVHFMTILYAALLFALAAAGNHIINSMMLMTKEVCSRPVASIL